MALPATGGKVDLGCTEDWPPACPQLSRCPRRLACRPLARPTTLSRPRWGRGGRAATLRSSPALALARVWLCPRYLAAWPPGSPIGCPRSQLGRIPGQMAWGFGEDPDKGGHCQRHQQPLTTEAGGPRPSCSQARAGSPHLPDPTPALRLQLLPLLLAALHAPQFGFRLQSPGGLARFSGEETRLAERVGSGEGAGTGQLVIGTRFLHPVPSLSLRAPDTFSLSLVMAEPPSGVGMSPGFQSKSGLPTWLCPRDPHLPQQSRAL